MKKGTSIVAIGSFILAVLAHITWAQSNQAIPAASQQTIVLNSTSLLEKRTIWIHTPPDYQASSQAYPVLYLLDGDSHFKYVSEMVDYLANNARISPLIVVAILNTDRTRDFTPKLANSINKKTATDQERQTGGALNFLRFIRQELIPYIDKNYRTQPYRILSGHSLGGLFATYAKQSAPDLFQSTLLISPAFHPEYEQILVGMTPFLQQNPQLAGNLFVTIGHEDTRKVDALVAQLKATAPGSFRWRFKYYEEENHFSVPFPSMYDGLRFIYPNWFIDLGQLATYKELQAHYAALSGQYGYLIEPTQELVNDFGYQQLRAGHIDEAITVFTQNTRSYPRSSNAFDSLGEAYLKKGDRNLAIKNYEKSLELDPNNESGKLALQKLKSKND